MTRYARYFRHIDREQQIKIYADNTTLVVQVEQSVGSVCVLIRTITFEIWSHDFQQILTYALGILDPLDPIQARVKWWTKAI